MASVRLLLGPADHGRRMTLEAFREAEVEAGYVCELARGVVDVVEVPGDDHGQVVSNLQGLFHAHKARFPGVIQRIGGGGEFRLWIAEYASGRNPDVAVVIVGTPPDARGRRPPSLVAEVVSRRGENRDYREKREEYWAHGVSEYWVVDPSIRQVLVLSRRAEGWGERVFRGSDRIASDLLAGFAGTVADLWTSLDDVD